MSIYAVCGKGGVGKTAFTAMFTKALLDSGKAGKLLVIDADPALGLANALAIRPEKTIGQLREAVIETARRGGEAEKDEMARMLDYLVMESLVERADFALMAMGRSETLGCYCPVNDILRDAITMLSRKFDTILVDGEAGLEQINRQVLREIDCLILLTDSSARGLQTVGILKEMVGKRNVAPCRKVGVVFNRVRGDEASLSRAAGRIGIEVLGFVPEDPDVERYDRTGKSLAELPPASGAAAAVRGIAERLSVSVPGEARCEA
jgi:CO dehydrogenase maturation factor